MKILHIHPILKTLNGSERVIIELSKDLHDEGHEVQVVTLWAANACRNELSPGIVLKDLGLHFGIDGFRASGLQYFALPLALLKAKPADVVIGHAFGSLPTAAVLAKILGAKLIYLCHEPPRFAYDLENLRDKGWIGQRLLLRLANLLFSKIDKMVMKRVDVTIVLDDYCRGMVESIYGIQPQILSPGVDTGRFMRNGHAREQARANYGLRGKTVLLSVGKLHARKNYELQMQAFHTLRRKNADLKLVIVGCGPHERALKDLAQGLGIADDVMFTGFVEEENLQDFYQMADIFVFTAYREPFGLVVLEAMASELPVVVPAEAGPTEIVSAGNDGLVYEQDNLDELCERVSYLIENPDERIKLGRAARRRAKEFSWQEYCEGFRRLL